MFLQSPETSEATTPVNTQWPDVEDIRKLPFDPYPRDSKFRKASPVYTDKAPKCLKCKHKFANTQQRHSLSWTFESVQFEYVMILGICRF